MVEILLLRRGRLENVAQRRAREGGHSVVAVHLHANLTVDPLSHHAITTILVESGLILGKSEARDGWGSVRRIRASNL